MLTWISRASALAALAAVLGPACTGSIRGPGTAPDREPGAGGGSAGRPGTNPPASNGGGSASPGGDTPVGPGGGAGIAFTPEAGGLRRLTVQQYRNSIKDLLGPRATVPGDLEPDVVLSGFSSVGAAQVALSPLATEQFQAAAFFLAHEALSDTTGRAALVGCAPAAATDEACVRAFLAGFGRRAWRRPLASEEVSRYVTVATGAQAALGDFWAGLEYGMAGLLLSPHFLYRVELGSGAPAEHGVAFDDWELATRLSFLLWNTTPDDALLDAAAAGRLSSGAGMATQAQRLLQSPRARAAVQAFFTELYQLGGLEQLEQSPAAFPQVTPTLGAAMRDQTLRTLEDLVFERDGDYRDFFQGTSTMLNAELAKLYGVAAPAGGGWARVAMPASSLRVGFLGQAAFLAGNAHPTSTSPTLRGKFIREVLLCQPVPPPPPDVNTTLPEDKGAAALTMRKKLEQHRQAAACKSCHQFMDPLGLGLENFDGVGALRTMEAGQVIDASGDLDGAAFDGPVRLAHLVGAHEDVPTCLARSLYRHATGHLEQAGEEAAIQALASRFDGDGHRFRALLLGLVTSPGFLMAAPSQ